ncbi:MAG: tyrosine-type recombinase/integrase [Planctomycetes bacterium]|nr:tyrosine-type recombinase/integrase [Planctomycetota bacterium]
MSPSVRAVLVRLQSNRFKSSYVFLNNLGRPFRHSLKAAFDRLLRRADLTDKDNPITPHALRRTFGTKLASKNTPLKVLMDLMGHSKLETTMKYYVKVNDDQKRAAIMTA